MPGERARLRRAIHPGALQVGHFADSCDCLPLEEFIAWNADERTAPAGSLAIAVLLKIEVTGSVAGAKLTETCFGTDCADHLVMVKARPEAARRWQIVTRACHVHAGHGLPPRAG